MSIVAQVVAVPVMTEAGVISHKGLVSDKMGFDGYREIIHNAKLHGQVVEDSLTGFCVKAVGPVELVGYLGKLPPDEVLRRARSQLGTPWQFFYNCEHFVCWCHGVEPKSPEFRRKTKQGVIAIAGSAVLATALFLRGA